ncbi:MAG: hypothetical protein HN707_13815 [Verrucomicrobia bacterium]|nr:hypothetical protein [Verrucomicrobiota bacterium]MBT4624601.1 hypothetical protein [Verrucomicrobiota bacterium]MBT4900605.1 hypothetical protein [Verrucomicrobiota bacterium]MBT6104458.1 hypothetical protein [Verrucomicrobiota bacterium]MBT6658991.1 hypothetical protein [Verrucomicrobiota bacterium]
MAGKKTKWSSCNLLEPAAQGSRLWQFSVSSKKVKLSGDLRVAEGDDPPAKAVAKDWRDLLSRKLNIATLPPEKVFLRVVELPECEPDELLPMVEFQIEDLSPLPMAQAVWSAEAVPGSTGTEGNQTVLVMIAERGVVEGHLDELEAVNYLADRVEVPLLRELVPGEPREDGAHIQLVQGADSVLALVSWWFDGRLRDVNSFNLPDTAASRDELVEKINSVALAGEVAGWMPDEPACHLAKRGDVAADWNTALAKCFGSIREVEPMSEVDLATAAVEFTARTTAPGLMLEDYSARNRQRFQDGLWMEGIKGAVALMLIGLLGFYVYGSILQSTLDGKINEVTVQTNKFTKARSLKAKVETLEKQKALKDAALKAWREVTIGLPRELKFTQLTFSSDRIDGNTSRKLRIAGTADAGNDTIIDDYHLALTRMEIDGQTLFSKVRPGLSRKDPRKKLTTWSLECEFDGE